MEDYNSTIPTFDQIEGNTLLQKMREMYNVLSENIKSEGAITKVTFENGIIEFSNEESTIASVDLSGVVINANLEGNSIVFTKIDNSKFSVSLEGLITDETAVLESRVDNLDDELNNVSSELATISSKTDNLETDNTSNKERISTLETDNTTNKEKISTLETNVNKAFINASFETQTSILTLTAVDGTFVKVTIPSGGGSGGGNVSDVTYDDVTKTITVNYVTGEPKTYTITQLTTLDSNLNSINTNIQEIETNLEELQTETYKSFINATFLNETSTLRLTAIDSSYVDVVIPSNSEKVVKDVTYNNENKTITVTYSEGEPTVYTLTELIGLTDKLNTLETFQTSYTPKIDNSFVNATKIGDTTLRLTRNDGTTVDISFPKGLNIRNVNLENYENITANTNELIIINGLFSGTNLNNKILEINGSGYLSISYALSSGRTNKVIADSSGRVSFTNISDEYVSNSGLLFNGGRLIVTTS